MLCDGALPAKSRKTRRRLLASFMTSVATSPRDARGRLRPAPGATSLERAVLDRLPDRQRGARQSSRKRSIARLRDFERTELRPRSWTTKLRCFVNAVTNWRPPRIGYEGRAMSTEFERKRVGATQDRVASGTRKRFRERSPPAQPSSRTLFGVCKARTRRASGR